jgi:sulfite reductase alpha subunit-like flavoprotein
MGTMTTVSVINSNGVVIKTTAAIALAAGAGALGLYVYRSAMNGTSGYRVGSSTVNCSKRMSIPEDTLPQGPAVYIFFGSQTGTAEEFAKMLAKEARSQGINATAVDLERFEPAMLPNSYAIFLVATYGEGDPTDNAKAFHEWLSKASVDALAGCQFAVFGLGNTQYEHYNSEGKFVDAMCEKCGGKRMLVLGLGDDDDNIRGDFDEWMDQLWPALREGLGMEQVPVAHVALFSVAYVALVCKLVLNKSGAMLTRKNDAVKPSLA